MEEGDRSRAPATRQQSGEQHSPYGAPYSNAPIPYQSDYSQDPQPRQFNPVYGQSVGYNLPPSSNPAYGSIQSYPPRQNAAIEVLSSQFSGAPQYYVPNDSPTAPAVSSHHHQPSSQFSSPSYSQYSPAQSRPPPTYSSNLPELNQPPPPTEPPAEDGEVTEQQAAALDEAYAQYQTALKRTFQNMRDGRLREAGTSLLTISDWLLSNVVELAIGLVRDEQELHSDRTRLWNEFNTCWLSVLDKQKQMLRAVLDSGHEPQPPQELLQEDALERMGSELVRLCDTMERHGLVDYQMGVWEEEIIDGIRECLELLERLNPPEEGSNGSRASREA